MTETRTSTGQGSIPAMIAGSFATGSPIMLVIAALVFLGTMGDSQGPTGSGQSARAVPLREEPRKVEAEASTPEDAIEATRALGPLWGYLGVSIKDLLESKRVKVADPERIGAPYSGLFPRDLAPEFRSEMVKKLETLEVMVVIASLPDPVESGSKFEFDMSLEAIQRAIESEDLIFDRFESPWRFSQVKGVDQPTDQRRRPGCLLYRDVKLSKNGKMKVMLLLPVGESPNWGVQRIAFRNALVIAGALDRPKGQDRHKVNVLGPTYSGSSNSMTSVIREWLSTPGVPPTDIRVCTGSATSVSKAEFEKLAMPVDPKAGAHEVIFGATILPDDLMLAEVLDYLANPSGRKPDARLGKTVMLVEGGTLYGNQFTKSIDAFNDISENEITFIPFPRRISTLRGIPELTKGVDLALPQRRAAALPLDEKGEALELFPTADPEVTQAADSLILTKILGTIAQENAHYVGVMASEVRNVLFLVKLINQYCPDVQLFLINNDILFSYDEFAPDFYGTIVATTYPLDSRNQLWSFPFKGGGIRRLFANDLDIGRYNACLVLMNAEVNKNATPRKLILRGRGEDLLVYGSPFRVGGPDSSGETRPCVWISTIGRNTSWPVRTTELSGIQETMRAARKQAAGGLWSATARGAFRTSLARLRAALDAWKNANVQPSDEVVKESTNFISACDELLVGLEMARSGATDTTSDRWRTLRKDREKLGRELGILEFQAGGKESGSKEFRERLEKIDESLTLGGEKSLNSQISKLARLSFREGQATTALELVPPVLLVDRKFDDLVGHVPGAEGEVRNRRVHAVIGSIPDTYFLVLFAWAGLGWAVVLWQSWGPRRGAEQERVNPSWYVFMQLTFATLIVVTIALAKPLLDLLPSARAPGWLPVLVIYTFVACAWGKETESSGRRPRPKGLGVLALVHGMLVYGFTTWSQPDYGWHAPRIMAALSCATLFLLIGTAACFLVDAVRASRTGRLATGGSGFQVFQIATASAMLFGVLWFFLGGTTATDAALLDAARVPQLSSGVSRIPTIVCLGLLMLAWCRFRLNELAQVRALPEFTRSLQSEVNVSLPEGSSSGLLWREPVLNLADRFDKIASLARRAPSHDWTAGIREALADSSTSLPRRLLVALRLSGRSLLKTCLLTVSTICLTCVGLFMLIWLFGLPLLPAFSNLGGPLGSTRRFIPTPEGPLFDGFFLLMIDVFLVVYVWEMLRLVGLWTHLNAILDILTSLPLEAALGRLPAEVSHNFGRFLGPIGENDQGGAMSAVGARVASSQARRLFEGLHVTASLETSRRSEVGKFLRALHRETESPGETPTSTDVFEGLYHAAREHSTSSKNSSPSSLSWALLPFVLEGWEGREPKPAARAGEGPAVRPPGGLRGSSHGSASRSGEPPAGGEEFEERTTDPDGKVILRRVVRITKRATPARTTKPPSNEGKDWLALAEDYVTIQLLVHLKRFAPVLRGLPSFLLIGPVLLLAAVTLYPFQPQRILTLFVWVEVLAAVALAAWVFLQIDRNPFVSQVSRSNPNAINLDPSLLRTIRPLLIPLTGLVLTASPNLAFWIRGLLEPLARAMK